MRSPSTITELLVTFQIHENKNSTESKICQMCIFVNNERQQINILKEKIKFKEKLSLVIHKNSANQLSSMDSS